MIEVCILKGRGKNPKALRAQFKTTQTDLRKFISWLSSNECFHTAMESTGVYWRPVYEVIEECAGHYKQLMVVNTHHMRNLPGRKMILRMLNGLPAHICSWAGLSPRNDESAGKVKSRKVLHGNPYIKSILCQCAWAAVRSCKSKFALWFWPHQGRLGRKKAIIAVARKLLAVAYILLKKDEFYDSNVGCLTLS